MQHTTVYSQAGRAYIAVEIVSPWCWQEVDAPLDESDCNCEDPGPQQGQDEDEVVDIEACEGPPAAVSCPQQEDDDEVIEIVSVSSKDTPDEALH